MQPLQFAHLVHSILLKLQLWQPCFEHQFDFSYITIHLQKKQQYLFMVQQKFMANVTINDPPLFIETGTFQG